MNESFAIELVYADDTLIVINKPAGLLSIPDGYNPSTPFVASCLSKGLGKVWIVHRLDRETSGVMIVARNSFAHRELNLQFEHHQTQKIYHALVAGFPEWERIEVDTPLKINGDRRHRTVPSALEGKKAFTILTVIDRYASGCLIEARPQTGYTHQIRAHLASLGFPIFGDALYQKRKINSSSLNETMPKTIRTFLHARSISFLHPLRKKQEIFTAGYPIDFLAAIQTLK